MQGSNAVRGAIQTTLRMIYPARCLGCGAVVDADFALCGPCRRDTHVIGGLTCDACGVPLPGDAGGAPELCDDCMAAARPWAKGRAALVYADQGRKLVLALKHGDRPDVARGMAPLLAGAARDLVQPDTVIVPVPLHWRRLFRRRYNQSALLGSALADRVNRPHIPDALLRTKRTPSLEGLDRTQRFAALADAITVMPRQRAAIAGRAVILVDDVMTSGATLSACADVLLAAQARDVCVVVLARVARQP